MRKLSLILSLSIALIQSNIIFAQIHAPKMPFEITMNSDGSFRTSDEAFVKSYPEMGDALQNITEVYSRKIKETLTLTVDEQGLISSSDPNVVANETSMNSLLIGIGKLKISEENVEITIEKNEGITNITNGEIYKRFDGLYDKLQNKGKEFANKMVNDQVLVTLSNDETIPYVSYPKLKFNYQEFKDCVGAYWFLPLVAQGLCGIGELIVCNY